LSSDININGFNSRIFESLSPEEFNGLALDLFQYQLRENKIYEEYVGYLGKDSKEIFHYNEIPFLPIGFYKSHKVVSGNFDEEMVFLSSGTSGMSSSTHHIRDLALYRQSFMQTFKEFYGEAGSYRILGLLPSYLEREGSSLVYMVKAMIDAGNHPESGFFLHDHGRLAETLQTLNSSGHPTLLIGVSFALLDFAEKYHISLGDNILIMETGGMKGRREEMTREALHQQLKKAFHKEYIHSEYGMTELLSQAYSKGEGHFQCPPWMKIMIRDIQDPFSYLPPGKTGAINIIDLANIHSCAFIETQDIGRTHPDGSFEVLGRTDSSDVRGCSLLVVN
jgi:phenylacetate-coenzyme A ligase PaaK-like adenylate-forming protein